MDKVSINNMALTHLIELAEEGCTDISALLLSELGSYLELGKPIPEPLRIYFGTLFKDIGSYGIKNTWNPSELQQKLNLKRVKGVQTKSKEGQDYYMYNLVHELRSSKNNLEECFEIVADRLQIENGEDKVKKAYYRVSKKLN